MDIYNEISEIKKCQQETLALLEKLQKGGESNNKKIYDLTDLENMFHVSRRTLFKWKSEGKLNFVRIGKKMYVTSKELERFLNDNKLNC